MRKLLILALLAAGAQPALARSGDQQGENDPNEIVCRRPAAELGTRIRPPRVCKSRAEWDAESRAAQEAWRNRQRAPSGDPGE